MIKAKFLPAEAIQSEIYIIVLGPWNYSALTNTGSLRYIALAFKDPNNIVEELKASKESS